MKEELLEILEQMKEEQKNRDLELAHVTQDELLIRTIRTLALEEHEDDILIIVNKIINTFEETDKWYA